MSLKSVRKGKYTGGSFASRFKDSLAMKSPLNVVVAGENNEEKVSTDAAAKAALDAESIPPKDEIASDTDYSKGEVGDFFQRVKLQEEQAEFDKKKKAEEGGEDPDGDTTPEGFTNDYGDTGSKKEIRAEKKENKKEIKNKFKDSKADIKDQGLKGKEKRTAKKDARKDKKSSKKANRQAKRDAKKRLKGK